METISIKNRQLERLPIFPLPNTVLFPNTLLPLHIFEPRYRMMARDLIESEGPVMVVQLLRRGRSLFGAPAVHAVGGIGTILMHKELPDGRFLAYKAVRPDFKDRHSGTIDNSVGTKPEMQY